MAFEYLELKPEGRMLLLMDPQAPHLVTSLTREQAKTLTSKGSEIHAFVEDAKSFADMGKMMHFKAPNGVEYMMKAERLELVDNHFEEVFKFAQEG